MAGRLNLSRPVSGLSYFYNVSGHVGWVPGNENNPDDVQLVQFLLREILMRGGGMAPGSWDFPDLSGKMADYKTLYGEDALAKIPSNPQLRISLRQALQKTLQTRTRCSGGGCKPCSRCSPPEGRMDAWTHSESFSGTSCTNFAV